MSRAQRRAIAAEAARLMMDEGIEEYMTAKHLAADALLGMRHGGKVSLPSNREIRDALHARAVLREGADRTERLFRLRTVAWELMGLLAPFEPRLIGSVASGAIHAGSDVDLQLFTARLDRVEATLRLAGHSVERTEKDVLRDGRFHRYVHLHLTVRGAPVELSIYEPAELWRVSLSSIDGKPIDRVRRGRVRTLLEREHRVAFARCRADAARGQVGASDHAASSGRSGTETAVPTFDPVLELNRFHLAEAWPWEVRAVDETTWLRLDGSVSDPDVGAAIAILLAYNDVDVPDATPAAALQALAARATSSGLAAPGGVRARAGDRTIPPGCCCGVEDWRHWWTTALDRRSPWWGHDPFQGIRWQGDTAHLSPTPEAPEPAYEIATTHADLVAARDVFERDLIAFLDRVRDWAEAVAPDAAETLVEALDRAFEIRRAGDGPPA